MTQYGVDLLLALILASLGLSALAIFISISRHRRNHQSASVMPGPGDDSAPEAARKVLREFEKNGQSVDAALVS
ncbi:MAG: trehalose-6-phosphate synthase, partial [Mesorhizobium sp.]